MLSVTQQLSGPEFGECVQLAIDDTERRSAKPGRNAVTSGGKEPVEGACAVEVGVFFDLIVHGLTSSAEVDDVWELVMGRMVMCYFPLVPLVVGEVDIDESDTADSEERDDERRVEVGGKGVTDWVCLVEAWTDGSFHFCVDVWCLVVLYRDILIGFASVE